MMLIITGVGSLIVIYSTEYMNEDRDYKRFFAEMSFFIFAMLLLVEAANYFFLIVGWGLVGLASYLLIGYYYDRPSATAAAKKAFVVNVIGDVGMVLAAFLLAKELGTLDYQAGLRRRAREARQRHVRRDDDLPAAVRRAPRPRARRCRSTPGCRTRWRARPRSAPSSTRPPW